MHFSHTKHIIFKMAWNSKLGIFIMVMLSSFLCSVIWTSSVTGLNILICCTWPAGNSLFMAVLILNCHHQWSMMQMFLSRVTHCILKKFWSQKAEIFTDIHFLVFRDIDLDFVCEELIFSYTISNNFFLGYHVGKFSPFMTCSCLPCLHANNCCCWGTLFFSYFSSIIVLVIKVAES